MPISKSFITILVFIYLICFLHFIIEHCLEFQIKCVGWQTMAIKKQFLVAWMDLWFGKIRVNCFFFTFKFTISLTKQLKKCTDVSMALGKNTGWPYVRLQFHYKHKFNPGQPPDNSSGVVLYYTTKRLAILNIKEKKTIVSFSFI